MAGPPSHSGLFCFVKSIDPQSSLIKQFNKSKDFAQVGRSLGTAIQKIEKMGKI